jgi:23S rRNA (adenine2503-C2)-methyltransferase
VDYLRLTEFLEDRGEPAFRADQVREWLARGAADYGEMSNLPAGLRAELREQVPISTLTVTRTATSSDGTVKALFETVDRRPLEAVLMRYRDGRRSICLSSQSGCPLTCTFCATGKMQFGRNLTADEIIDQALHFRRIEPVDHAVFMGMGEPMMNLDSVFEACERLPEVGIANSKTTISTVGWLPGIERMANEGPSVRLALSLHAPEDALRSEIMPVNDRYPIAGLIEACLEWRRKRKRKVFVEYLMLEGVNDSPDQARQLAALLGSNHDFKVNLIRSPDQVRNWLDSIKSRQPTVSPIEDAVLSDAFCHVADIAIRLRRKLTYDIRAEQFPGDSEANQRLAVRPMRTPWGLDVGLV